MLWRGRFLVLVRDVPRGGVITDGDLGWQAANPSRPVRNAVDADAAVGLEARRALKAGQPLPGYRSQGAGRDPQGRTGEAGLRFGGRAPDRRWASHRTTPRKGEGVRVLNTYSKRTVEAVAAGHGEARVNSQGQDDEKRHHRPGGSCRAGAGRMLRG